MKRNKLAFVDLETTGLDPTSHEIFEIGIIFAEGHIDLFGKSSLTYLGEAQILLKPEHIETADLKALEISKYEKRDFSLAVSQKEGLVKAKELLTGTVFVAQNVTFDWAFLLLSGKRYGVNFDEVVHYHKLDLASMVFGKLYNEPKLFKFSLRELTVFFDVKNENAHTALSDARATFEVCKKLLELP